MRLLFCRSKVVFCFIVFLTALGSSANAQINFSSFPAETASQMWFRGDSDINAGKLRLITAQGGCRAAVWHVFTHRITNGFTTMFTFRITNATGMTGGADGFAFVIHSAGVDAMGNSGGQIGYASDIDNDPLGIPNSLAFEFDTYKNDVLNDPDNNHLSIHTAGQAPNDANENASLGRTSAIPNLKDGAEHTVRIEYDGPSNAHQMRIYVDNLAVPKLTRTINLSNILLNGGPEAFVGFTGACAFEWEIHEITNWSFSPKFPTVSSAGTAADADVTGASSVTISEYHPGADATTNHNSNAMIDTAVLPDRKTEMWAKYYFPNNLSGGPYPLAVLLHGNHGTCGYFPNAMIPQRIDGGRRYSSEGVCIDAPDPGGTIHYPHIAPSHRGYDYLANLLTSWGYIVVSVNANYGINAREGYLPPPQTVTMFPEYTDDRWLILARGRLVLKHLQRLAEWNQGISSFITEIQPGTTRVRVPSYIGWYGMKITTGAQPITVRALGRIYHKGNNQTHRLRIIKASDNSIVAATEVTMTDMTHNQFKYANLAAPVTLAANTSYYIVSEERNGGDLFYEASDTNTQRTTAATLDGAIMSINNGGSWKNPNNNAQPYGPVNFIYEAASTTPAELGVNLKGKIDFGNVGLMGHSRGGEGMRAAYELYRETNSPWQTRIPTPLTIKGIFEIAPTDRFVQDRNQNLIRLLNADRTVWNVVLPACDGDVGMLDGVMPFDRMLENLIPDTSPSQKSTYFVYGANHNFYNTEWQESDSNGCIGPDNTALFTTTGYESAQQRKTGASSFLAFFRANIGNSTVSSLNQNFNPRYEIPTSVSSITKVERGYTPSLNVNQTREINDLTSFTVGENICLSSTVVCSTNDASILEVRGRNVQYHPRWQNFEHDDDFAAVGISWTSPAPNRHFQVNLVGGGSVNASTYETLDFRISRRRRDTPLLTATTDNDVLLPHDLNAANLTDISVQLVMNNGSLSVPLSLSRYSKLEGPVGKPHNAPNSPFGTLHPILKTVRIPLADFPIADLTQIRGVRFVFNDTSSGAIFLSNVRISR